MENRSRLLMEIVNEVREAIGEDMLLLVRLGIDDLLPGELSDVEIAADMVQKGEADFIALGRPIMNQPNFVEELIKKMAMF